jgi:N-acetylneuraminic acid mutarotase
VSLFQGNKLVLFGGQAPYAAGSQALGDTWVWDGNYWAELMIDGPSPRAGANAATEPGGDVILFGGSNLTGVPDATLTDTFRWDGSAWTQLNVAGPPLLYDANMCTL